MSFPILNFEQTNAGLTAVGRMQDMAAQNFRNQLMQAQTQHMRTQNEFLPQSLQEQLKSKQLENALSQNTLNFAPQMSQAGLADAQKKAAYTQSQTDENNARVPLYQAQGDLAQQQAKYFPYTTASQFDPLTKMLAGRMFLNNMGGGQQQPTLQTNDGGMTVQPPNGQAQSQNQIPPYLLRNQGANPAAGAANLPVLPGGLNAQQGQQAAQQMGNAPQSQGAGGLLPALVQHLSGGSNPQGSNLADQLYSLQFKNQVAQMGKDPMFGTNRSGQGGTYVDPFTGKTTSTDTGTQTTRDQRAIASIDNVNSYLGKAMDTLPQFQGAAAKAKLGYQGMSNFLAGTDYAGPSQYASGKAAVLSAAEGFINAFGLNATNENVNKAAEIMTPAFGESGNGYKKRAASQLKDFADQQQRAANRLSGGEDVSPGAYAQQGGQAPAQEQPQVEATKTVRGKQYYLVKGVWHE